METNKLYTHCTTLSLHAALPIYARHLLDRAADPFDDELHDAQIIEDRDQRGEKDDHGQRRDREAVRAHFGRGERAEDEIGAGLRIAEPIRDAGRHRLNPRAAPWRPQHQHREARLTPKDGDDDAQPTPTTTARHTKGDSHQYHADEHTTQAL